MTTELRDLRFLLYDWLDVEQLCARDRFAEHDRETFDTILETAATIARETFADHAAELDRHEPVLRDGRVELIPQVKKALEAYVEAGFMAASFPAEHGGLQLPYTVSQAANALFQAANPSTAAYPLLTMAAANLLLAHGTAEQVERWVRPMLEGRFTGTMALSEPQAGSSLADLRTRAEPQPDGTYRIFGDKMWISAAEHDLAENIVHLVLARIPGGPPGVKGISLFAVPKHLDDGARNDVHVVGLNHKMGYRGTVNTVLLFGEGEGAVGHLVGDEHAGLRAMFHMMNEARIGVGLGAASLAWAGYRFSLDYAKGRPQGRLPWAPQAGEPVPIVEHPDVRRMLLAQKAYAEGGLALGLYCARLVDERDTASPSEAADLGLLLDLLTPIAKAWPSWYGVRANELAIQVLGGYGYSTEYPVERIYRDNRLNPIHEGTNGIQALDLLGRKVRQADGRALQLLLGRVQGAIETARRRTSLAAYADDLQAAVERATTTTMVLLDAGLRGDVPAYLANASVYLDMLGHTVVAWLWLEQALVADRLLGSGDDAFLRGKLAACRYFFRYELPNTAAQAELLQRLDDTTLTVDVEGL